MLHFCYLLLYLLYLYYLLHLLSLTGACLPLGNEVIVSDALTPARRRARSRHPHAVRRAPGRPFGNRSVCAALLRQSPPSPCCIWMTTGLLLLYLTAVALRTTKGVAQRAAAALQRGEVFVQPCWLSAVQPVHVAASAQLQQRGWAASVGGEKRISEGLRNCVMLDMLTDTTWPTLPPVLQQLAAEVDELRAELAQATGRPLLESAELQLLCYPPGGHYRRHVDVGTSTQHLPVRRSISILIFLTQHDWSPADGGQLRAYAPHAHDIESSPGTLVLFDSAAMPHAVLPTRRERHVCVGWLLEPA